MAASGLNNVRTVKADDSIAVRWHNLATLVEFALELKKALQCINEQSFNHFVLKMGINHGPITAGKPQSFRILCYQPDFHPHIFSLLFTLL